VLADADAAGLVGACVLMVFTRGADDLHARIALCAVAALTPMPEVAAANIASLLSS